MANREEIEDGTGWEGLVPTAAERRAEQQERMRTEITYKGFAYNVRSDFGVDTLRRAIKRDGND